MITFTLLALGIVFAFRASLDPPGQIFYGLSSLVITTGKCFNSLEIFEINIMKTCPCNVYPRISPYLYSKTGVCRGIPIFLFLPQNIHCGHSFEPPRRGGSNMYTQFMFKNKKNIRIFQQKNFQFFKLKISVKCMGHVFVM